MAEPVVHPFPLSRNPPGSEARRFRRFCQRVQRIAGVGRCDFLALVHASREADAAVEALLTKTSTTLDLDIARQRPECGRPSS